jgi:hypothetical protein
MKSEVQIMDSFVFCVSSNLLVIVQDFFLEVVLFYHIFMSYH